jgi:hypothetical protein
MRPSQENLDEQLRRCTVRVEGKEPCGTGFFVAPQLILTCAHVVDQAQKQGTISVAWNDRQYGAQVEVMLDRRYPDLAVLRAGDLGTDHPCVYLQGGVKRGDTLYGWGFPRSYKDGDSLEADYEGPTGTREWRLKIKNGQVQPGFSGAPLLNRRTGGVCGVVKSTRDEASDLGGWAIPAEAVLEGLPDLQDRQRAFHQTDRTWARHVPLEMYLAGVQEYCGSLPYLTLSAMPSATTLPDVFVPLKMKPADLPSSTRDLSAATRQFISVLEGLDIEDVVEESARRHLILLGGAGSGKSCLLRYLAMNAWLAPHKIGLDKRHIPLLVSSRSLAEAKGSMEDRLYEVVNNVLPLVQKLPAGLLRDWPEDTGYPWLLMLDALDEIPEGQRAGFFNWLKPSLKEMTNVRVIVASRYDGDQGAFDSRVFSSYYLRSLSSEQAAALAERWLGSNADRFVQEMGRRGLDRMLRTPLLITLAAMVYASRDSLPQRLAILYGESVEILLREARRRGLETELDPRVRKVVKGALASLALELTRFPSASPEQLKQRGAKYLKSSLNPISEAEAAADGATLVDVLGRHSGMFARTGDSYAFVHATFREYLSALDVAERLRRNIRLLRGIVRVKFDKDDQVIRFLLGILSDDPPLVQKLVKSLYGTSRLHCLLRTRLVLGSAPYLRRLFWRRRVYTSIVAEFLAECLIQGVAIDKKTRLAVVSDLNQLAASREERKFSLWLLAADKLGRLGDSRPMAAIARDVRLDKEARENAIAWLSLFNYDVELESLCNDPEIDEHYRTYARSLLQRDRHVDSLVHIAGDGQADRSSRLAAIARLLLAGHVDQVMELEKTPGMNDVLYPFGRLLTGIYIYGLRRRSRQGTLTPDAVVKLGELYQGMSKYMVNDEPDDRAKHQERE